MYIKKQTVPVLKLKLQRNWNSDVINRIYFFLSLTHSL